MHGARIAAFNDACRAARVLENDSRHVFAADARLDALSLAVEARRLAHQEARDVEHVDAEIEDREMVNLGKIGLLAINVVGGAEGNARPGWPADRAGGDDFARFA